MRFVFSNFGRYRGQHLKMRNSENRKMLKTTKIDISKMAGFEKTLQYRRRPEAPFCMDPVSPHHTPHPTPPTHGVTPPPPPPWGGGGGSHAISPCTFDFGQDGRSSSNLGLCGGRYRFILWYRRPRRWGTNKELYMCIFRVRDYHQGPSHVVHCVQTSLNSPKPASF